MPKKNKTGSNAILDKHPKFASLTFDATFKRAFATEPNKDLLVFLLNTFLKKVLKQPICDVTIINPANLAKKGMQKHKNKKIPYDFNFPVIYTLSFLQFDLDFGKGCDEVIQYLSVSNNTHPDVRYDIMHMVYVRLSMFNKIEEECKTDADMLLFSLKNANKLNKIPSSFKKPEFKRLFEIAKISNFTKMEHMDYIRRMMAYSDQVHTFNFAKKKSMEEGRQDGLKEGLEKGRLEGKREDAKAMLADGLTPPVWLA
jgi:hypothetical protein